jgi:NAD(P)-dependent dehydrogenase (short-subunit alcohol dehydrogenase family)
VIHLQIDLSGRTALISGSTAGIGFAIAAGMAGAGANVYVNGRRADRVDAAVAAIGAGGSGGGEVRGIVADVGTSEGVETIVAAASDVDILVHNAVHVAVATFMDTSDEEWERAFQVNVIRAAQLTRALLPSMLARGWGRVIFISSESAVVPPPELLAYGVSKTALQALARGIAAGIPGSGVTVNSVLPGPTLSEGLAGMLQPEIDAGRASDLDEAAAAYIAENRSTSLLGRMTQPREVANLVVYLASDQASGTIGSPMRVDGGVVPTVF